MLNRKPRPSTIVRCAICGITFKMSSWDEHVKSESHQAKFMALPEVNRKLIIRRIEQYRCAACGSQDLRYCGDRIYRCNVCHQLQRKPDSSSFSK